MKINKVWIVTTSRELALLAPDYKVAEIKAAMSPIDVERVCVDEETWFDGDVENDVVLVETRLDFIIRHLESCGYRHTGESPFTLSFNRDKTLLKGCKYIRTPRMFTIDEVVDGVEYFVKPKFSENSIGIDERSLCKSRKEVLERVDYLKLRYRCEPLIEEYIDGLECTVGVVNCNGNEHFFPIVINPNCGCNWITERAKNGDTETFLDMEKIVGHELCNKIILAAFDVFCKVKAHHYMRIDMRIDKNGVPYIIETNLYPGLAGNGYLYRGFEVQGRSYHEMINVILESAFKTDYYGTKSI
ncbi:MAG: hypothetical protein PHH23_01660 [Paludibacteraceae bacterium]|nr:hypothetical protein [Paludibacteraceae bacterium]